MEDTKVDFFTQTAISKLLKKGERQVTRSVTTYYCSWLDHVYTYILSCNKISGATLETFYSDHKPIVTYLSKD